MNADIVKKRKE